MLSPIDDTIVALSSPPGYGARGIVRLSGPRALAIAAELFADDDLGPLEQREGMRRFRGELRVEGDLRAPAELYLFRSPRSYTRQDLIELHTVGSPALLAMVLDRAVERGARLAEAGEFTSRAFFNGAMDLAEAESVAAVIRAQSDAQLRRAQRLREGELTRRTAAWMERLAELTALVEADIDFAEEPIEFITPADLRGRLATLRAEIDELTVDSDSAERFETLPTVLLVGPANAGKSSLMNALSGTDRAICSAVAGTTRDILTTPLSLPGLDCLILDGAGLTQTDDELIQAAQAMTRATASGVDLLCQVLDITDLKRGHSTLPMDSLEKQNVPLLIALNKSDLLPAAESASRQAWLQALDPAPVVCTSARTGAGLEALKSAIRERLGGHAAAGEDRAVLLNARQRTALAGASAALDRATAEAGRIRETIDRADVIAFELREALEAVGSVCGGMTTEDLLNEVFANFCIGK